MVLGFSYGFIQICECWGTPFSLRPILTFPKGRN